MFRCSKFYCAIIMYNFDINGILFAADNETKKENVDSVVPTKSKTSDELQRMTRNQLREEAVIRGISASGTKRELLDRICSHNDNDSPDSALGNRLILLLSGKVIFKPNA